jgi:hypothetical protein
MTKDIVTDEQSSTITCTYDSTTVALTVYHWDTKHLTVSFTAKGRALKQITYFPVSELAHQKLMLSDSIGTVLTAVIKQDVSIKFEPGDRAEFERLQKKKRGY